MGLVWQCARCGNTDRGTDDQREGQQPPDSWLRMYVPIRGTGGGGGSRRSDVICDTCEGSLCEWFHNVDGEGE